MDNSGKLSELIEIERAAIGHEIHDAVLPLLFGASAVLHREIRRRSEQLADSGQPADSAQQLIQATAWVDTAMQISRRILGVAYPPELATASWDDLVSSAVASILKPAELPDWELQIDVAEQAKLIAAAIATAAYRISVEAIRNAVNHGNATKVELHASVVGKTLHLRIRDNGSGFDPSLVPVDRYGIRSMKGRAELVAGTLRIESQTGGPTTVHFLCEMNDQKESQRNKA